MLEYYGSAPSVPHESSCRVRWGIHRRWPSSSRSGVARGSRFALRSGREAAAAGACDRERRVALKSEAVAAEQTRLRRVEALEAPRRRSTWRPLRIECYDVSNIQEESPVASMVVFQDGVAKRRTPEVRDQACHRARRLRGSGRGHLAALCPHARRGGRGVRRVVRGDAQPRRGRRRQGAALGGAGRDAGLRPATCGRDLAREAGGEVFVPDRPSRSSSTGTSPASSCSSGSATRRTASPSASTASGATRRRGNRSSTRSRASARPPACPAATLRFSGAIPRSGPGGAGGSAGHAAEDRPLDLRPAAQGWSRLIALGARSLPRLRDVRAPVRCPQRDEERREAERDVDGYQRQAHPDAERERAVRETCPLNM